MNIYTTARQTFPQGRICIRHRAYGKIDSSFEHVPKGGQDPKNGPWRVGRDRAQKR